MAKGKEIEIVKHVTMSLLEIFVVEITARGPHGHDDLEIGMVLEGSLILYIDQEEHILKTGDIYIINRYQVHSFAKNSEYNRILAFQISTGMYRTINYSYGYIFLKNNIIHSGYLYNRLREGLMDCAMSYFSKQEFSELRCASILLEQLFLILTNSHYAINSEQESTSARNDSMRLNRIIDYIAEHYTQKISLCDIAKLENITTYHASHFITRMLGISFQDYVNQVRFERALQLIDQSSLSILDICMESGFSSSRYLNQMFEKVFSCTVKEYRRLNAKPQYKRVALPTENIQKRYTFEQSRLYIEHYLNMAEIHD